MRIDFINDGSHDCPLIRLISDQKDEIELMQYYLKKLGESELNEVNISDLHISVSKIKLIFKLLKSDRGLTISKNKYILNLSKESYLEMAEKLDPFLVNQNGFTWLYDSRSMSILFTTDGYW